MKFKIMRPVLRAWRSRSYQPGTIGRSLALGLIIGFSPTVGAQMIICLIVCFFWNRFLTTRVNIAAALVGSMVVNPITMGPTYFVYYKIGCLAIDCRGHVDEGTFDGLSSITQLGGTVMLSLWIGSLLFMIAGYPVGWYIGNRVEAFLESRKKKRLGRSASEIDRAKQASAT